MNTMKNEDSISIVQKGSLREIFEKNKKTIVAFSLIIFLFLLGEIIVSKSRITLS